ncbi:DUF4198 domain-containing protein [Sphingomonas lycopersici]|uniref:DUF4198 domain-containing protein n=1 Tax=Sphingomonas lycopersici TaxID=2951807 RepID=A0AA41ZHD5_9SPHN|nr:DUF4198 domain-containing protein [Sphingomonas lycopersici]MCW6536681.1 DUF4198 domain-containing protein [Sphingomonas lycopersici]
MPLRFAPLCLLGLAVAADAHDFWLQAARWQAAPGEPIRMTLQVGHGPYRQRSPIPARRIVRFAAIAPNGRQIDLRRGMHIGGADDATAAFGAPGTYVVVLETDNRAESHLPAIRFNDYLKVEGLTPAIALRTSAGRMDADGAENYSRHAKAIVRVGPVGAKPASRVTKPAGLALEIVPEADPLTIGRGGALPVRIYYRGTPLAGALVKLNDLDHDAEPVAMRRSDAQGRAVFRLPGKGNWQLNVIWTRPQPKTSLTDFDTSFSSLSFGAIE